MIDVINKAINSHNAVLDNIVEPYRKLILELPKEDQQTEWKKYNQLTEHLELQMQVIEMLYTHIGVNQNPINAQQQIKQLQNYVKAFRAYVVELGGNPSNVNFG